MDQKTIEEKLKSKLPGIEAMFLSGKYPVSVEQTGPGQLKVSLGNMPYELTKAQIETVIVTLSLTTLINPEDFGDKEKEEAPDTGAT